MLDLDETQRWAAWAAALDRDTAEGAVSLMWAGYLPQPADAARHIWDSVAFVAAGDAVDAALLALVHAPGYDSTAGKAAVRRAIDAWRATVVPAEGAA